jgi:hypothetical protein
VEIKQAYKQLARKYHPNVSPPGRVDEYTKRFILVQEAYEILSDPRRVLSMIETWPRVSSSRAPLEDATRTTRFVFLWILFSFRIISICWPFLLLCKCLPELKWVFEILFNWFNF